jgi:hypothetical protein
MALIANAGCTTVFRGEPKVPNGVSGCKAICSSYGMELTGMVAMGEYSDGCICQVPGKPGAAGVGSAAGPAAVAVVTMIRQEEAQRQAARH